MSKIKKFIGDSYCIRFLYMVFIHWPVFFFGGIFKRNKNFWLIACQYGFADNSKYFYLYYHDYLKEKYGVNLIWLANKKEDVNRINEIGFEDVVLKRSVKGVWFSFKAKVYISSHGIDCFFKSSSKNALVVNLWHGVGIKSMRFKGKIEPLFRKALSSSFSKILYPSIYKKYDLFLSTSALMTEHFSECFDMERESFFVSEYPRNKLLTQPESNAIEFIKKYEAVEFKELSEKLIKYQKVFIYMPTWRDGNPKFLNELGVNWQEINKLLAKQNRLLILKVHPACEKLNLLNCSNIQLLDPKLDIYPILPLTDCLITDYSSIYFDYLLTGKNIALFTFDYEDYMTKCRDFSYPFDENMVGYRVNETSEFFAFFENYNNINFSQYQQRMEEIRERFWSGNACLDDFVAQIIAKSAS